MGEWRNKLHPTLLGNTIQVLKGKVGLQVVSGDNLHIYM